HDNDRTARALFEEGKFEIIRKPPDVMLALRRIVYDNDYQASDLKHFLPPRWQPQAGSGWKAAEKTFSHDGQSKAGKDGVEWLPYYHILRPLPGVPLEGVKNPPPELITDQSGYNSSLPDRYGQDNQETRRQASRGRN